MTFPEYMATPGAKTLKDISDSSDVSIVTVKNASKGMKIVNYNVAKAISDAIGRDKKGELFVSVAELCE